MMLGIYLGGLVVAFGYQLADDDFRLYDLIVCPIFWPAVLVGQIVMFLVIKAGDRAGARYAKAHLETRVRKNTIYINPLEHEQTK